jgi:hypothetical protein
LQAFYDVFILHSTFQNLSQNKMVKENFCGACIAVPLALAGGAGVTGYSMTAQDYKKRKTTILIVGALSLKDCKTCLAP